MIKEGIRRYSTLQRIGSVFALTTALAGGFYFRTQSQELRESYESISRDLQEAVISSTPPTAEEIVTLRARIQSIGIDKSGLESALQSPEPTRDQSPYLRNALITAKGKVDGAKSQLSGSDVGLLYSLVGTFFAAAMTAGIFFERKRNQAENAYQNS